jgi:hypothetical protein
MTRVRISPSLCLIFSLMVLLLPNQTVDARSNFTEVRLPRGVTLELPNGWWLLGDDLNRAIDTAAESALDLSGITLPPGDEVVLVAANSMPRSTYAAVRVTSTTPPSFSDAELDSLTLDDMPAVQAEMAKMLELVLPQQGLQILSPVVVKIGTLAGHVALVTEYTRSGPKGPVWVQISQISSGQQEIQLNLSYRVSEAAIWRPVVGKIRNSISVSD